MMWYQKIKELGFSKQQIISALFVIILAQLLPFIIECQYDFRKSTPSHGKDYTILDKYIQISSDTRDYINMSADFPRYLNIDTKRINRPLYSIVIDLPARLTHGILVFPQKGFSGFLTPTPKIYAVIFGCLINTLTYIWILILAAKFYKMLGCEGNVLKNALYCTIFFPHFFWMISRIAPDLFAYAMTFLCVLSTQRLILENQSVATLIKWGLLLGIMALGKMQYDVIGLCFLGLIFYKKYKEAGILFITHLLPQLGWIELVRHWGLSYNNWEVYHHRQVIWIWESFLQWDFARQIDTLFWYIKNYLFNSSHGLGLFFLPVSIMVALQRKNNREKWIYLLFFAINFVFLFIVKRPHHYMIAIGFFISIPLFCKFLENHFHPLIRQKLLWSLLFLHFLWCWPSMFYFTKGIQDGKESGYGLIYRLDDLKPQKFEPIPGL